MQHFFCFLQVTQLDVKLFFESVCGEVCDYNRCKHGSDFLLDGTSLRFKRNFISRDILSDAGLSPEAARGLSSFYSYCFCGVCDGNYLFLLFMCTECSVVLNIKSREVQQKD